MYLQNCSRNRPFAPAVLLLVLGGISLATQAYAVDVEEAPTAAKPASVAELVQQWEGDKPTTQTGEALVRAIVELGPPCKKDLAAALDTAYTGKSLATGLLQSAVVRLSCKEAIPVLFKILRESGVEKQKRDALLALAELRDPSVIPQLVEVLNAAPDPTDRKAQSMEQVQTIDSIITTLRMLSKGYDAARTLTSEMFKTYRTAPESLKLRYIQILAGVESSAGEDMLLNFTTDTSARIRYSAIAAIGDSGTIRSAPLLLKLSKDSDRIARISAITSIGKLKFTQALPEMLAFLGDKDKDVSTAALFALRQTTGCWFDKDPEMWKMWLDRERQAAESSFKDILEQLRRTDGLDKAIVLQQVGRLVFMRHKFVEAFSGYLDHPNAFLRASACNVLAQSYDPKALPLLLKKLDDTAPEVANAAWRGLRFATGQDLPRELPKWKSYLETRR